jgi:hypothetical protein
MDNTTLNGVVAIIEERPEDAKAILGDTLDRTSRATITARLYRSLEVRDLATKERLLRRLLMESLKIKFPEEDLVESVEQEAFFMGVKAVEDLIEKTIKQIQAQEYGT